MNAAQIMTSVLFANGITMAAVYAVWRLRRDEGDLKAIGLFLLCCLFVAVIALAAR